MIKTTYMDSEGIADYYQWIGKTATADLFRDPKSLATKTVTQDQTTWIPSEFVLGFCHMVSTSPSHADRQFKEIQSRVTTWIPA